MGESNFKNHFRILFFLFMHLSGFCLFAKLTLNSETAKSMNGILLGKNEKIRESYILPKIFTSLFCLVFISVHKKNT